MISYVFEQHIPSYCPLCSSLSILGNKTPPPQILVSVVEHQTVILLVKIKFTLLPAVWHFFIICISQLLLIVLFLNVEIQGFRKGMYADEMRW